MITGLYQGVAQGLKALDTGGIYAAGSSLPTTIAGIAAAADPGQTLADIMGTVKPTLMWYGGDASGATELIAGTNNLSDSGTPNKEQTDHALNVGTKTTEFDDNTTDAMDAASSSVADIDASTPFAMLLVVDINTWGAGQYLAGKREPTGSNIGYELRQSSTDSIVWICDTTTGAVIRTVTGHSADTPITILVTRFITKNEQGLYTSAGSNVATRNAETLSNAINFSLGKNRTNSAAFHLGLCAMWINAGEDFDDSHRAAFHTQMGY